MKQWVYCVNFHKSYEGRPYRLYIKHLSKVNDFANDSYDQANNSCFHEELGSFQ